jgi:hypothetical protein
MNKTAVFSGQMKIHLVPIECAIKYFKKRNFGYRKKINYYKTRHGNGWTSLDKGRAKCIK